MHCLAYSNCAVIVTRIELLVKQRLSVLVTSFVVKESLSGQSFFLQCDWNGQRVIVFTFLFALIFMAHFFKINHLNDAFWFTWIKLLMGEMSLSPYYTHYFLKTILYAVRTLI